MYYHYLLLLCFVTINRVLLNLSCVWIFIFYYLLLFNVQRSHIRLIRDGVWGLQWGGAWGWWWWGEGVCSCAPTCKDRGDRQLCQLPTDV